jgi:hypothetical protein
MKRHTIWNIYYILRLRCAPLAWFTHLLLYILQLHCTPFAWFTIIVVGVKRDSYHDMGITSHRNAIASYTGDLCIVVMHCLERP